MVEMPAHITLIMQFLTVIS